jgi:hypothetical protein
LQHPFKAYFLSLIDPGREFPAVLGAFRHDLQPELPGLQGNVPRKARNNLPKLDGGMLNPGIKLDKASVSSGLCSSVIKQWNSRMPFYRLFARPFNRTQFRRPEH